ncbi:hypothetical protein [Longirhabdus pacifica]|uniref:hypothetical protein n=1 Tax=Longirhabdus pacifica TaxID=2305227 RepID=UPI0013E8C662|nr:hypothetical protein [Longirhabdus pacifica]
MHEIFQRQGIPPDEIFSKPRIVQQFMLSSMILVLEEEERERKRTTRLNQKGGR